MKRNQYIYEVILESLQTTSEKKVYKFNLFNLSQHLSESSPLENPYSHPNALSKNTAEDIFLKAISNTVYDTI